MAKDQTTRMYHSGSGLPIFSSRRTPSLPVTDGTIGVGKRILVAEDTIREKDGRKETSSFKSLVLSNYDFLKNCKL